MHILFISDSDYRYGAAHSLLRLIELLVEQSEGRVRVTILLSHKNTDLERLLIPIGVRIICVPFGLYNEIFPYEKWKFPFKYVIRLVKYWCGRSLGVIKIDNLIDFNAIDVIHCNSSRVDLGAVLSKRHSIPLVWHLREFFNLDYRCYSYRRDYITCMNNTDGCIIAVSNAVRDHWIKKGIRPNLIKTIYNGVDGCREYIDVDNKISERKLRLIMAGSLSEGKGHLELIRAVEMLSDKDRALLRIDIVGDGKNKYQEHLLNKVKRAGLQDTVFFLGYKSHVTEMLHNYDAGLMCSRAEAFGRVTAEYMMAGIPVIASDTGANPELIRDGIDGLLYQQGNAMDLCERITYCMDHPEMLDGMGRNACKRARAMFDARNNAEQIYWLYKELITATHLEGDVGGYNSF